MARLGNFNPVNEWTKAGVMIRASGAANAANAFVAFTGSHGNMLQTRATAGAATTSPQQNGSPNGAGEWLKLVRTGDTFTGYHSRDDRATWVLLGSATIAMPASVQVGVVLSAHDPAASATAALTAITLE